MNADSTCAYHFLGFVMHQPEHNLLDLLNNEREAHQVKQILLAYQRPVEYAELYEDVARFCVCFSGVLLEQLQDNELIARVRGYIDIPTMVERYRAASNIELAGTGYYHPLFPLIPEGHWREHIVRGRDKIIDVFKRAPTVFWPPEMGFSCYMIPYLVDAGYRYVTCDGVHVRPSVPLTPGETIYRPHVAEYGGKQIILIPRDGQLSEAQLNGTEPDYVRGEVLRKTGMLEHPGLVTTWTDGENGGWFRDEHNPSNFWGRFFQPHMERVRTGSAVLIPTTLPDFLSAYPVDHSALALTGTWKYHPDQPQATSFEHWADSDERRGVLGELFRFDEELRRRLGGQAIGDTDPRLRAALDLVLRAEASDNFWKFNPGWLDRSRGLLREAWALFDAAAR